MELVLRRRKTIFEVLSPLFRKKDENIYFEEEGVVTTNDSLLDALGKIEAEIGDVKNWETLEIIDSYFTNVKCEGAERVAEEFYNWIQHINVQLVAIHTERRNNCFERFMTDRFGDCFRKPIKDMHDRLWIFKSGDGVCIVSVGGSFNGLGKKVCLVNKVLGNDTEVLMEVLAKNLEGGNHVDPDLR